MSSTEPLAGVGVGPLAESAKILELHLNVLREPHNLADGGHDLFDERLIRFCKGVLEALEARRGPDPTRMVLQRLVTEGERGVPATFERITPDEEDFKALDVLPLHRGEAVEEPVDPS